MPAIISFHRSQTKAEILLHFKCGLTDWKDILFLAI